jgi:hypothetical protein
MGSRDGVKTARRCSPFLTPCNQPVVAPAGARSGSTPPRLHQLALMDHTGAGLPLAAYSNSGSDAALVLVAK